MNGISIKSARYTFSTFGLILVLNGCLSPRYFSNNTVDVTNNPAWWGQLARNSVLQVRQDTLLNGEILTSNAYKITDDYNSSVIFGGTISVEQFKANPNKYWPELRLLPKGTRLQCIKLIRVFSLEYSHYAVWAEILDGEFKGKMVDLGYFVSGDPRAKGTLVFDSDCLERAR